MVADNNKAAFKSLQNGSIEQQSIEPMAAENVGSNFKLRAPPRAGIHPEIPSKRPTGRPAFLDAAKNTRKEDIAPGQSPNRVKSDPPATMVILDGIVNDITTENHKTPANDMSKMNEELNELLDGLKDVQQHGNVELKQQDEQQSTLSSLIMDLKPNESFLRSNSVSNSIKSKTSNIKQRQQHESHIAKLQAELAEQRESVEILQERLDTLLNQKQNANQLIARYEKDNQALLNRLANLSESTQKEHELLVDGLNEEISQLRSKISDQELLIASLELEVESASFIQHNAVVDQKLLMELSDKNRLLKNEIEELRRSPLPLIVETKDQSLMVELVDQKAKQELEALKRERELLLRQSVSEDKYLELETKLEETIRDNGDLLLLLNAKDSEIASFKAEQNSLQSNLKASETQSTNFLNEIKQLESVVEAKNDQIDEMQKDHGKSMSEAEELIKDLSNDNEKLLEKLRSVESKCARIQEEYDELLVEASKSPIISKASEELEIELNEKRAEMESLSAENARLKTKLEVGKSENSAERSKLTKELESVRSELDWLRAIRKPEKVDAEVMTVDIADKDELSKQMLAALKSELELADIKWQEKFETELKLRDSKMRDLETELETYKSKESEFESVKEENEALRNNLSNISELIIQDRVAAEKSIDEWEKWATDAQVESRKQLEERDAKLKNYENELHDLRKRFGAVIKQQEESIQNLLKERTEMLQENGNK